MQINCTTLCECSAARRDTATCKLYAFQQSKRASDARTPLRSLHLSRATPRSDAQTKDGNIIIRSSVSAATAVLNLFNSRSEPQVPGKDGKPPSSTAEVKERLEHDYLQNQYFVTGNVDLGLYTEDCLFADPTFSFRGRRKYQRNLRTLTPFFLNPKIQLFSLEVLDQALQASWRLTVTLKLPWKPLVDVNGKTLYSLDSDTHQVVEHRESWNVSALDAIKQIFARGK